MSISYSLKMIKEFIVEMFPLNEGNDIPYYDLIEHHKIIIKYIIKLQKKNEKLSQMLKDRDIYYHAMSRYIAGEDMQQILDDYNLKRRNE